MRSAPGQVSRGTLSGSELENHPTANAEDDWRFTIRSVYDVEGSPYSGIQGAWGGASASGQALSAPTVP